MADRRSSGCRGCAPHPAARRLRPTPHPAPAASCRGRRGRLPGAARRPPARGCRAPTRPAAGRAGPGSPPRVGRWRGWSPCRPADSPPSRLPPTPPDANATAARSAARRAAPRGRGDRWPIGRSGRAAGSSQKTRCPRRRGSAQWRCGADGGVGVGWHLATVWVGGTWLDFRERPRAPVSVEDNVRVGVVLQPALARCGGGWGGDG